MREADASAAKRALGCAWIGEKLCEEGNDRAADKKFKVAFGAFGMDADRQLDRPKR